MCQISWATAFGRKMAAMRSKTGLSDSHRKVVDDVEVYGWHFLGVLPEGDRPGWGYTIGLHETHQHPELIVFGLGATTMHKLLSNAVARIEEGIRFADGASDDEILERYPATFRAVHPMWFPSMVGYAGWFYEGFNFPLLQLFWPDAAGAFPWEPACNPTVAALQPRLFLADPIAAGAAWLMEQ